MASFARQMRLTHPQAAVLDTLHRVHHPIGPEAQFFNEEECLAPVVMQGASGSWLGSRGRRQKSVHLGGSRSGSESGSGDLESSERLLNVDLMGRQKAMLKCRGSKTSRGGAGETILGEWRWGFGGVIVMEDTRYETIGRYLGLGARSAISGYAVGKANFRDTCVGTPPHISRSSLFPEDATKAGFGSSSPVHPAPTRGRVDKNRTRGGGEWTRVLQ